MTALAFQDTSSLCAVDESGEVVLVHDGSPPEVMRARIDHLVLQMRETFGDELDLPTDHELADGLYIRRLFIPKGWLLAGKIHLKSCFNVVEKGDITILTEFGCKRVQAGFTGVSRAGIQKIGYAHEDTVFVNVFRTDETDLEKIEAEIASTEHLEVLGTQNKEQPCLSHS
jgi:hypothetical protein